MNRILANANHMIEGMKIMFNDEEDEDVVELLLRRIPEIHHKIQNFFEETVPLYSPSDFKCHFRMSEVTFEVLVERFGNDLININRFKNQIILPDKMLAISIWTLANQEPYRCIGDRFGLAKMTIWRILFNVINVICRHASEYIVWPRGQRYNENVNKFEAICGFPNVIGCLDGCEIPISAPTENANSYINRKGFHSITLQGICDSNYKFIDVFAGYCGSVHDSRIWNESHIKAELQYNRNNYIHPDGHILADAAYPLSNIILTPYRDNGHLTPLQINYNVKHSITRCFIERTFGILKCRFRRLRYLLMFNTDMISSVILACCIFHNICIDVNDEMEYDVHNYNNAADGIEDNNNAEFENGVQKRNLISELLYRNN